MPRRLTVSCFAAGLAAVGCAPTSGPGPTGAPTAPTAATGQPDRVIEETDALRFEPGTTTVAVGQVVAWHNGGSLPHDVLFDDPTLEAQGPPAQMNRDDTWQTRFPTAGTFHYRCTFHPAMEGTITVR